MKKHQNLPTSRAGTYIPQPKGYRAFIPKPLPPSPPLSVEPLQPLLSEADRALGHLDGSIQTLPNPDLFVYMYVRKEAVLSSQIEGTQSSLQDLLSAEADVFTSGQPKDVNEVINHVHSMNLGLKRLAKLPLSVRLIREIHAELMKGVRGSDLTPGELRTSQNWIGPSGSTVKEAIFVPPPPGMVGKQLEDLELFYHNNNQQLPLLIKIGLAHAQFETIHPFLDDNGRIGRLIITFMLCEQKVLLKPVLYLSHYFKQHQQQYYAELQSVREAGTWEKWLSFFLHGVIEVSKQATDTARNIIQLREKHRMEITAKLGQTAGNGHRVLEHLYSRPMISIKDVVKLNKIGKQSAGQLVKRMTKIGILQEVTGQVRNRKFAYQSYINLFDHL